MPTIQKPILEPINDRNSRISLTTDAGHLSLPHRPPLIFSPVCAGSIMKMFIQPSQVFLCRDFVDFLKSINGLSKIVEKDLELSSMSVTLFGFCNKAKDKLKILCCCIH
ncbi:MAG: hypothetical protein ACI910_000508 [Oleispira sp.]